MRTYSLQYLTDTFPVFSAYYEVLTFTTMLPQDLTLAPNVLLQVWDYNGIVNGRIPIAAVRQRVLDIPLHKSFQSP